ncbi:hypothetical protein RB1258 [Rhodopirellula baltica SH 1]|uniref:Uncharacterized protein n=1 Tax=Rhodopirellula baltica (strain DSM 10527 / NCIMB 13988 / SH1) TaxID=243090 RepID=Q7UXL2_RHOBA|nr:hypothetical protein RB1258 [Rhodopirellula baltica SH 1]
MSTSCKTKIQCKLVEEPYLIFSFERSGPRLVGHRVQPLSRSFTIEVEEQQTPWLYIFSRPFCKTQDRMLSMHCDTSDC